MLLIKMMILVMMMMPTLTIDNDVDGDNTWHRFCI